MLTKEERERLLQNTLPADYTSAAKLYTTNTGVRITPKYLRKIVMGERGRRPRLHNPQEAILAVIDTVRERRGHVTQALKSLEA